mgnify:CR=1 FL=1
MTILKKISFPSNVAMPLDDCDEPLEAAPAVEEESSAVTTEPSHAPTTTPFVW